MFEKKYMDFSDKDEVDKLPLIPRLHYKIIRIPLTPSMFKLYVYVVIASFVGLLLN
jgi:hypothetical protein